MEDRLVSGVFSGRPFGGTAVRVRNVFANRVSVVDTQNSRITSVRVCNSGQANMAICSVYMPWNDGSSRQLEEYKATLGYTSYNRFLYWLLCGLRWGLERGKT